jgi:hypothetical protein
LNPLVQGAEFTALQDFLTKSYPAPDEYGPPDTLDTDTRARILSTYAETNRMLFSEYMPNLPKDSYADDIATFALGDVLRQPTPHVQTIGNRIALAASLAMSRRSTALVRRGRGLARRLPLSQQRKLEQLFPKLRRLG